MLSHRIKAELQARADAFARDWNLGVAVEDLHARYGMRSPVRYAYKLREKGYPLVSRCRRERYAPPEPDWTPMMLLRPKLIRPDVHARFQMVYDRAVARDNVAGYVGTIVREEWEV